MNILPCEQTSGQMLQAAKYAVAYTVLVHSSNNLQIRMFSYQTSHVCTQLGPSEFL